MYTGTNFLNSYYLLEALFLSTTTLGVRISTCKFGENLNVEFITRVQACYTEMSSLPLKLASHYDLCSTLKRCKQNCVSLEALGGTLGLTG